VLLDDYMPEYDVANHHEIVVDSTADRAYEAARTTDLSPSLPAKVLFAIRGIPHFLMHGTSLTQTLTLDSVQALGFVILAEDPGEEIVIGVVGRFWRPDSGFIEVAASEFVAFERPGFAKAAISVFVRPYSEGRCLVGTETRVQTTDEPARRKFAAYWLLIGPFSGFIRKWVLEAIKNEAERSLVSTNRS
jgi:hypothetical protein